MTSSYFCLRSSVRPIARLACGAANTTILTVKARSLPEMTFGVTPWPTNGVATAPHLSKAQCLRRFRRNAKKKAGQRPAFPSQLF
jgi:hypothetical protein